MSTHYSSKKIYTHVESTKYVDYTNHDNESPIDQFRIIEHYYFNVKMCYTFYIEMNNKYFTDKQQKIIFVEKLKNALEIKLKIEELPPSFNKILSSEYDNLNFVHTLLKVINKVNKLSIDDVNKMCKALNVRSMSKSDLKF